MKIEIGSDVAATRSIGQSPFATIVSLHRATSYLPNPCRCSPPDPGLLLRRELQPVWRFSPESTRAPRAHGLVARIESIHGDARTIPFQSKLETLCVVT
jgi:hypothetical protein